MSGVTVVPEGHEPEPAQDEAPLVAAGPQSPLALLRGKREAFDKKLHHDLAVPRRDELVPGYRLWVRYGPADPGVYTAALQRRETAHKAAVAKGQAGDPKWQVKANADLLVDACEAVYFLPEDEEPPEGDLPTPPEGEYATFASRELSELIGAPLNAAATALKLYATSADLLLAAAGLLEWSGEVSQEADRSFLTN